MLQSILTFIFANFIGCVLLSSSLAMAETCTLDGKPVKLDDGSTTAGKTGMVICQQDGKLWRKFEYKNGKQSGYTYFANGNGGYEEFYTDAIGNKDGPQKKYSKNGKLIMSATYKNGGYLGLFQDFFDDGKPRTYSWYEKANTSPSMEIVYHQDGSFSSVQCGKKFFSNVDKEICGFNGVHVITLIGFNGATETRTYKNGAISDSKSGNKAGLVLTKSEFKDGLEHKKSFFDNGSLKSDEVYKGSAKVSDISYYMNGNRKSEITYQETPKRSTRLVQEFSNSGKLVHKGNKLYFSNGGYGDYKPIGLQEDYFDSGAPHQTQNFSDIGDREGEQKLYDEKGTLQEFKIYQKDILKHGKFYDKSGDLKSEREYFPDGSYKEVLH